MYEFNIKTMLCNNSKNMIIIINNIYLFIIIWII